jgi:hypothetical protein
MRPRADGDDDDGVVDVVVVVVDVDVDGLAAAASVREWTDSFTALAKQRKSIIGIRAVAAMISIQQTTQKD